MMGEKIKIDENGLMVPDNPRISFIQGDGIGADIWSATKKVIDKAVEKAYTGQKKIYWEELLAGEKAFKETGEWLPDKTLEKIKENIVAIKGPLTTPVGAGYRSLNVAIRQELELYACIRPVKWLPGVPSPVKKPENVDMVVFRENMEDIYMGLEWPAGSREARKIIDLVKELNKEAELDYYTGIGIKPISKYRTEKITEKAVAYAIKNGKKNITIVHKGNIMKYTEGAFKKWAYKYIEDNYKDKIMVNDRIADNMLQQILINSEEYDILLTSNLNGDYLSDALAAQVGGLGIAPGSNIGDSIAVFEATHGSAPDLEKNRANPVSLILSGKMMLEYMGWYKVATLIQKAIEKTIEQKIFTDDIARNMKGVEGKGTAEYADWIIKNL